MSTLSARLAAATVTRHVFLIHERPVEVGGTIGVRRLDGTVATATVREKHDAPVGLLRLVLDVPGGIDRAPR